MAPTNPDLLRVCITADGHLKATFSDCSLLLLSPSATSFLHISPQGRAVQQCTQFALHSVQSRLSTVLELRNLHCNSLALCKPFLECAKGRPQFVTSVPVEAVRWSGSTAEAAQLQLSTTAGDGQITLVSEDRCAKLELHPSGLRLAVTWPALVPGSSQSLWVTQSFSAGDCPAQWEAPLQLAIAAQQQWASTCSGQDGTGTRPSSEGSGDAGGAQEPRHSQAAAEDLVLAPAQRISKLPPPASHPGIECCSYPPNSWWFDTGTGIFPPDTPLLLEWTPGAVFQYLPSLEQVEVVVHMDGSLLRVDRRGYLWHYCPGSWRAPKLYSAEAVPSFATGGGTRYPLAVLAAHAQAFREVSANLYMIAKDTAASQTSALSGNLITRRRSPQPACVPVSPPFAYPPVSQAEDPQPFDDTVLERQVVPGHGTFTAFADGRVHAGFCDRTLVKLLPGAHRFEALLPSGQTVSAPVSQAAELSEHVASACEFAGWAACSPAARALPQQLQCRVHAQLDSNQRLLRVLDSPSGGAQEAGSNCWPESTSEFQQWCSSDPHAQQGHGLGLARMDSAGFSCVPSAGNGLCEGKEQADPDYMLEVVTTGSMRATGQVERETFVDAWLRRNSLLLEQL
ncbi:hypothetical protein N2152v2_001959 [Parachlorella kessleri]